MTAGAGDDDVALLAVAFAPTFRTTVPASPEKPSGLRRELRGWLAAVGTDDDTASDVLLACGEAAANAVEHAFPEDPGELTVELRLSADRRLTLRVADTGQWRRVPAPGDRGRGLPLMRAVMDSGAGRARGGRDGGHHATPVGSGMSARECPRRERRLCEERAP